MKGRRKDEGTGRREDEDQIPSTDTPTLPRIYVQMRRRKLDTIHTQRLRIEKYKIKIKIK